jgi:hypothetical protein
MHEPSLLVTHADDGTACVTVKNADGGWVGARVVGEWVGRLVGRAVGDTLVLPQTV